MFHIQMYRICFTIVRSTFGNFGQKIFKISTYDRCVENQIINRVKFKIVWYMYGNKLYHMYKKFNNEIIKDIK